jgi:7-cyano-7-deazaguanine synthase
MKDTVAIVSGGMDSTTLLYRLRDRGFNVVQALSFNYGQRHSKELSYAARTCYKLFIPWEIFYLDQIAPLITVSGSSLVSDTEVPEGHYAEDNMKQTVVPNRNMVMLAIAGAVAVAKKAEFLATGVHAGDHFVYPDCRPDFVDAFERALLIGNEGFIHDQFTVLAPYLHKSKAEIAREGVDLGLDYAETWSCYKGGDLHCGRCGTCVERLEAIAEADAIDTSEYEDNEYWKTVIENA